MTDADGGPEPAPITCAQHVDRPPAEAFAAFTDELGSWWDPRLTPDAATFRGAELEPRPGGAVRFVHAGPTAYQFAAVTTWRPPERLELAFWLALDPDHPTTLTVDFTPAPEGGTLVGLAHGGWDADNVVHRRTFDEWPSLLARYAAHVARHDA